MKYWLILLLQALAVLARSPTGGYAPGNVTCPDKDIVREANDLSSEEQEWLESRNPITKQRITQFLKDSNLTDFDVDDFMKNVNDTIKIGLAFSGGGYRAMLNGAGQLLALDDRYEPSNTVGLGGILQSSTYLAGLSGGNWLVGSFVLNNYTSIDQIIATDALWDLENSIIDYGGWNVIEAVKYYTQIYGALNDKGDAGYDRSITDIWGRALSYQLLSNYTEAGVDVCWSDIRDLPLFKDHEMPFPVVVADGRTPGEYIISGNSTVFEINPFELGSWDPSVNQFVDVKYLGTHLDDGKPVDDVCVSGYDNAGFIMGTSSSLFNQFILQLNTVSLPDVVSDILQKILNSVSNDENDIAIYEPNPFKNSNDGDFKSISDNETLFLCDGGEDLQNVPLYPLMQAERALDVVFAYDNSADTNQSWPDGASLIASYERQFLPQGNGSIFPYVPDKNTFINQNLTSKPTFFGCDAKNLTTLRKNLTDDDHIPPLLIYMANRPFSYWSNTSTFQLSYDDDEKKGIIQNGFEVSSRYNRTLDDEWNACVSCAIIRRTQERLNLEQSEQCKQCFEEYCWDGTTDASTTPGVNFTETGSTTGAADPVESYEGTFNTSDRGHETDEEEDGKDNAGFSLSDHKALVASIFYGSLVTFYFLI
ncbi:lysophospholipase 1 [[Candida] jaroonii]|uniref:Lysophospholipase 1 n=1 Tax=[Candida] jaroonii TaxID=467808 RepID=A0ACA9YC42_9ASCO|nr:lysophospholipase 1 [[Candida] jaroonii]